MLERRSHFCKVYVDNILNALPQDLWYSVIIRRTSPMLYCLQSFGESIWGVHLDNVWTLLKGHVHIISSSIGVKGKLQCSVGGKLSFPLQEAPAGGNS